MSCRRLLWVGLLFLWAAPFAPADEVDDFETDTGPWIGLARSTELARSGVASGRWVDTQQTPEIRRPVEAFPEGPFAGLRFSLHSMRANQAKITIRLDADDPAQEGLDYYGLDFEVDWEGWREFTLPFYTFYVARRPERSRISQVAFAANWLEAARPGTELHLDDFAIVEKIDDPSVVLDSLDFGTRRWARLAETRELVRGGAAAGLWDNLSQRQIIHLTRFPTDWSEYEALCFSVYAERAAGTPLTVVIRSENPDTPGEDYYKRDITLDWEGWRDLKIPFSGFLSVRSPLGWDRITGMTLASQWDHIAPAPDMPLVLDEFYLTRVAETPDVTLDDMEGGTERWSGLESVTEPVRTGRRAGRWASLRMQPQVRLETVPADWRPYEALVFSLFSPEATGDAISVRIMSPSRSTAERDHWGMAFPLDWTGWREVEVPLRDLPPTGSPVGWGHVTGLVFAAGGEDGEASDIAVVLDDVRLRAAEGSPPAWRLVLDDMEAGPGLWDGLAREETVVAQGRASARWDDPVATPKVPFRGLPQDLTPFTHLCLSVHHNGVETTPLVFMFASVNPATDRWDYYHYQVPLGWRGWRHVRVPLADCEVSRGSTPLGWHEIQSLHLAADWAGPPTPGSRLYLDNVYLERAGVVATTTELTRPDEDSLRWVIGLRNTTDLPLILSGLSVFGGRKGLGVRPPAETTWELPPGSETEVPVLLTEVAEGLTPGWAPVATCRIEVRGGDHLVQTLEVDLDPLEVALTDVGGRHPGLLFTADETEALRERLGGDDPEQWAAERERLLRSLAVVGDSTLPAGVGDPARSPGAAAMIAGRLASAALVHALDPDEELAASARELLALLSQAEHWLLSQHRGQRGVDERAAAIGLQLAMAYDWLHPALSERERRMALELLDTYLFTPLKDDLAQSRWYTRRPDSATYGVVFAGVGFAALAALGEVPAASEVAKECITRVREMLDAAPRTGGWTEGPAFWEHWITFAAPFAEAVERVTGGLLPLAEHPYFAATGDFALHMWPDAGGYFTVGDSGAGGYSPAPLLWLARRWDDPQLADLALRRPAGRLEALSLLWGSPITTEGLSDRPTSRHFAELDWTVLRSGWGEDDLVCFLRSGPRGPRGHLDAAAVAVSACGVRFLRDIGREPTAEADYFDPVKRWTFPKAMTESHNCLLIDGKGQTPAGDGGSVTDFFASDICDFVTADATSCYEGARRVARALFMARPGYLLMHDEVTGTDDCSLAARFHPGKGVEVTEEGGRLVMAGKTGVLRLHVIHPDGFTVKRGEHDVNTPFIDVALPAAATHNLLTLMHAHRADAAPPSAALAADVEQDVDSLRVTLTGDASEDVITIGRADGTWRWVSTSLDGGPLRAFCREAQLLTTAGDALLVRSSVPVTAALEWTAEGCRGDVRLAESGVVEIAMAREPRAVEVNGREAATTTIEAPLRVRLELPAGSHRLAVGYVPQAQQQ